MSSLSLGFCILSDLPSVVIGNCGFGFAPCKPADRDRAMMSLARNEAVPLKTMQAGMPWDWVTFEELLGGVNRTPKGVNMMSFVPLAPLYGYVVGIDEAKERRCSDAELATMCEMLVQAMEVGGCGFSAQIAGDVGNVQLDFDGTPMVTGAGTSRRRGPGGRDRLRPSDHRQPSYGAGHRLSGREVATDPEASRFTTGLS